MRALFRWIKRLVLLLVVLILGLLSPVAYVELMCRPQGQTVAHVPLVGANWPRARGADADDLSRMAYRACL